MCGPGGKPEEAGPAVNSRNIELEQPRPPTSAQRPRTAARPTTGAVRDRPTTKHRSHTSAGDPRPKTHQSERRHRPEGSSAGGRRTSHRESHTRGERSKREATIQEHGHTEDKKIFRHFTELGTFTDQHVANFFFPLFETAYPGISEELDDIRTREHSLRKYIIQRVIEDIVMGGRDSTIANEIAVDLGVYANSNDGRVQHLESICHIGSKLRMDFANHTSGTSGWQFGSMEEPGYIVVVPALFKDGSEVVASQMFRLS